MTFRKPFIPHLEARGMAVQDDLPAQQPGQTGIPGVLVEGSSGGRMDMHDPDLPIPQQAPAHGEKPPEVIPQFVLPGQFAGGRDERECLEAVAVGFDDGDNPAIDRGPIALPYGQYPIAERLVNQCTFHACSLFFPSRRVTRFTRSYRCRRISTNHPFFSSERKGFASNFASTSGNVSRHRE